MTFLNTIMLEHLRFFNKHKIVFQLYRIIFGAMYHTYRGSGYPYWQWHILFYCIQANDNYDVNLMFIQ